MQNTAAKPKKCRRDVRVLHHERTDTAVHALAKSLRFFGEILTVVPIRSSVTGALVGETVVTFAHPAAAKRAVAGATKMFSNGVCVVFNTSSSPVIVTRRLVEHKEEKKEYKEWNEWNPWCGIDAGASVRALFNISMSPLSLLD